MQPLRPHAARSRAADWPQVIGSPSRRILPERLFAEFDMVRRVSCRGRLSKISGKESRLHYLRSDQNMDGHQGAGSEYMAAERTASAPLLHSVISPAVPSAPSLTPPR